MRHPAVRGAVLGALVAALLGCGSATHRPVIAVIGDSYTAGMTVGGTDDANWTQQLDERLRANGHDARFVVEAGIGSGYVSPGFRGLTFEQMARVSVPDGATAVILFGSINDALIDARPATVGRAVRHALEWMRTEHPGVPVLVIGPAPVGDDVSPELMATSRAVITAARRAGVSVVDPVADGWFTGADADLISADGLHPTDAGHRYIADKIVLAVEELLADRPAAD